ncbi:hypothetical protein [Streptomyces jeddahensis]|uniref:Uncharacterized protein n=1 Tax=Streptomyces jeddahensis TaxID=1716141 RepID=A0A177HLM6_9ACTN|nr:hypothetical protein [Streptomyces jeddahensis]OAH11068.1 hypothetical protein STSP_55600 [Streptomyces jeddahensis]
MDNDTDATVLLDLDGLVVERVKRLGARRVHLITADDQARACPGTFRHIHQGH